MTDIAVLGLGHMGAAMAARLLTTGHSVTVWNRTAERATPLTEAGAVSASSPARAVANAELVISMLSDATAVTEVLFGDDGAAEAMSPGAVLIEMSTIGPAAMVELNRRLPAGVSMVDAPVMGSVPQVEAGTLTVLAGGEAATVERVAPILATFGAVKPTGGSGSGAAAKLVGNAAMLYSVTAVGETLALAAELGLDEELSYDLLSAGPLAVALGRSQAQHARFKVSLAAKDIALVASAVSERPHPMTAAAREWLNAMASAGSGEAELAEIVGYIQRQHKSIME